MAFADDGAMESRLGEFLNRRIGRHLARREQKESFALYAHGILADGERKSVEPIAARATGSDDDDDEQAGVLCERMQARLLNFLRDSPWDDRSVRREAARYVLEALEKQDREPLWLVMEWPDGETKPTKFVLTTLPRRMTKKQIVRIIKERWRTERAYEKLKASSAWITSRAAPFPVGIITCRSS